MGSIVGLDIGTRAIRAVEVQSATKSPTILRYGEIPVPEGAVRDGEVLEVSTIASALRSLWNEAKFSSKSVSLGIGGSKVFARDLAMHRMPLERIRESLPFQSQELLPMPVSEAILDYYPIAEEISEDGAAMVDGLLIAAQKDMVSSNVSAVIRAGLKPKHVDLVSFALARALLPLRAVSTATLLIAIGASSSNVIVAKGGAPLFLRSIPTGSDNVARSIATRLQLPIADANALVRLYGMGSGAPITHDRLVVETVYAAGWELLGSIRDTLSYFTASRRAAPLDGLVLTGSGVEMPGLTRAMSEMTGLPATMPDPIAAVTVAKSAGAAIDGRQGYATALGLALGTAA